MNVKLIKTLNFRKPNLMKTTRATIMLGALLTAVPLVSNAQDVFIKNGDRKLRAKPTLLADNSKATLYYIDTDRNPQTAEACAFTYRTTRSPKDIKLANGAGVYSVDVTQYADTLVTSSYSVEGTKLFDIKYYITGPCYERTVLTNSSTGEPVVYFANKSGVIGGYDQVRNSEKMEISQQDYNNIKMYTGIPEKHEHTVYVKKTDN